jgi:predicted DCC family thiol-disulfide oxidoreductase YuxK
VIRKKAAVRARETVLIFDGDCAFCTSAVGVLQRILPVAPKFEPYQWLDLDAYGLTTEDAAREIWLVTPRRQYSGYLALARLLQLQPHAGYRMLGYLADVPLWSWVSAAAYRWVAANRHRLPGGTPACAMPRG